MQRYADALEADKGGAENVSAAERSMIEVAAMARGCASLILIVRRAVRSRRARRRRLEQVETSRRGFANSRSS
jgi:hypothetical protein